jgi:hypothetical protein
MRDTGVLDKILFKGIGREYFVLWLTLLKGNNASYLH